MSGISIKICFIRSFQIVAQCRNNFLCKDLNVSNNRHVSSKEQCWVRITNKNVNIGMCVQGMILTFCSEMFDLCSDQEEEPSLYLQVARALSVGSGNCRVE